MKNLISLLTFTSYLTGLCLSPSAIAIEIKNDDPDTVQQQTLQEIEQAEAVDKKIEELVSAPAVLVAVKADEGKMWTKWMKTTDAASVFLEGTGQNARFTKEELEKINQQLGEPDRLNAFLTGLTLDQTIPRPPEGSKPILVEPVSELLDRVLKSPGDLGSLKQMIEQFHFDRAKDGLPHPVKLAPTSVHDLYRYHRFTQLYGLDPLSDDSAQQYREAIARGEPAGEPARETQVETSSPPASQAPPPSSPTHDKPTDYVSRPDVPTVTYTNIKEEAVPNTTGSGWVLIGDKVITYPDGTQMVISGRPIAWSPNGEPGTWYNQPVETGMDGKTKPLHAGNGPLTQVARPENGQRRPATAAEIATAPPPAAAASPAAASSPAATTSPTATPSESTESKSEDDSSDSTTDSSSDGATGGATDDGTGSTSGDGSGQADESTYPHPANELGGGTSTIWVALKGGKRPVFMAMSIRGAKDPSPLQDDISHVVDVWGTLTSDRYWQVHINHGAINPGLLDEGFAPTVIYDGAIPIRLSTGERLDDETDTTHFDGSEVVRDPKY